MKRKKMRSNLNSSTKSSQADMGDQVAIMKQRILSNHSHKLLRIIAVACTKATALPNNREHPAHSKSKTNPFLRVRKSIHLQLEGNRAIRGRQKWQEATVDSRRLRLITTRKAMRMKNSMNTMMSTMMRRITVMRLPPRQLLEAKMKLNIVNNRNSSNKEPLLEKQATLL